MDNCLNHSVHMAESSFILVVFPCFIRFSWIRSWEMQFRTTPLIDGANDRKNIGLWLPSRNLCSSFLLRWCYACLWGLAGRNRGQARKKPRDIFSERQHSQYIIVKLISSLCFCTGQPWFALGFTFNRGTTTKVDHHPEYTNKQRKHSQTLIIQAPI